MEQNTPTTIAQKNEVIALYMGEMVEFPFYVPAYQKQIKLTTPIRYQQGRAKACYPLHNLPQFNSSYEWLMPVVNKVMNELLASYGTLPFFDEKDTLIDAIETRLRHSLSSCYTPEGLTQLYNAVYEAVIWLGQNKS